MGDAMKTGLDLRDNERKRPKFERSLKKWEAVRGARGNYVIPAVQAAWEKWLVEPRAKRTYRKLQDRYDLEIQLLDLPGRDGLRWNVIKSFTNADDASICEREYCNSRESENTNVRVKKKRVPIESFE
jgi:hypothetical protein